jgi:L-fucose isomerase-like protein
VASARPKIAVFGCAYGGYNLGEELAPAKIAEFKERLSRLEVSAVFHEQAALDVRSMRECGESFSAQPGIDCVLCIVTTFVPDHFVVSFLDACDKPIFLWAVEREMRCISVVCGPLITATLYELGKKYMLVGADIGDDESERELLAFSRAAMALRAMKEARVGYIGGKNNIMFNMTADDFAIKRTLGTTIDVIPLEEFYDLARSVPRDEALAEWREVVKKVGACSVAEESAIESTSNFLAARALVEKYSLDAISINCFPYLKSRICLAVSLLSDMNVASACEGDLYSTILMLLLGTLTETPSFNGDFLRLYPENQEVLFSHCGSGAFGLSDCRERISLQKSIETNDGVAVVYPTRRSEHVTLLNLIGTGNRLRLAMLHGRGMDTDLEYEGTPMRVRFEVPTKTILRSIVEAGAGHHWNGTLHDVRAEIELLSGWTSIPLSKLG